MRANGVIFDCDGTLVDSEPLGNEVLAELLATHGMHISRREAVRRFRGMKLADCLAELEAQWQVRLPAEFATELRQRTADAFRDRLKPMSGALDLVRTLSMPTGVASSGPREKIELSLSLTGLLPFFGRHIYSSYEIGSWKPDPGIFLHAARQLGIEPARCMVVEDSLPGIHGAIAAGMQVVAFQPGAVDPRLPPDMMVVRSMQELGILLSAL